MSTTASRWRNERTYPVGVASMEFQWLAASGNATLYSWTILRQQFHTAFTDVPMLIAVVALDDYPQVHLVCNVAGYSPEVLGDPEKRKRYDELGANWQDGGGQQAYGAGPQGRARGRACLAARAQRGPR